MSNKKLGAIAAVFAFAVTTGGMALAQSKCDAKITKAAGKNCACKTSVIAKAQRNGAAPDAMQLNKCRAKFDRECAKAMSNYADCDIHFFCGFVSAKVDACVAHLSASPSGAFLE